MDSGWAGALATIFSTLVIAATAIAAFLQLRHGRNANDIVVYLRLIDYMDSPAVFTARQNMAAVAKFAEQPEYKARLADPLFVPEEMRTAGEMLRYLEHISVLVTKGGVAEGLILAEYADNFVRIWELMRPTIIERRKAFGPHTGRAFEHLAMRAKRYIDSGQMERDYAALERDPRT